MIRDPGAIRPQVIGIPVFTPNAPPDPRDTFVLSARIDMPADPRTLNDPYKMTWTTLSAQLQKRGLAEHIPYLQKAYEFAEKAHAGQKRDEGQAYIHHPLRVAWSLLEDQGVRDPAMLAAGLLHDTLEDSSATREELEHHFGARATDLVASVTKPKVAPGQTHEARNQAYFDHLQDAPHDVVMLKLADRIDNLRYLHLGSDEQKKVDYKAQTRKYFIDLAERHDPALRRRLEELIR